MKRPPHRALRFLRWFCKEDYLEEVEGDVLEIYDEQCKTSPRKARWGLLWNVLRHFHPVFMKKPTTPWNITSLGMLHNYFKVAWRSAQKQWLYATINLGGLALGLTCFILVLIYLKHENSYDRFLQNSSQVYRVYQKQLGNEHMGTDLFAVTPYRLAPAMTAEYPEVVQATSVREENALLAQDGKSFLESGYMADSHFFSVFAFPFLVGDAASALDDPASLVITESLAKKMFGDTNPLGQEIRYQDETSLKITGIVKDLPSTSSLQFSFISTLESSARYQREMARDKWYNSSCHTFFTLAQDADPSLLEGKLADLLDRNAPLPGEASLFIQSIHELHFAQMNADLGVKGNPQYVRLFSLVALLILSLASINYINLAVARTMKRAKEVGMRKVVGATRRQLIGQFLGESVLITMVAFLLALLLVGYLSPLFGHLISRPLTLNLDENLHILPILVGLVLVVGVLSGSYPALWISAFQPLGALQGRLKGGSGGMRLHRWFMVGQFAVSVALIFGSIVIYRQFEFIQSKELGYDKEQVITVSVQDDRLSKEFEAIRTQCLENPRIQSMTASWHLPTNITSSTVINDDDNFDDNDLTIYESRVTYDYLEVFGMQLLAGRFFSPAYATDFDQGYVLNETAAKALGWSPEEAIGKQFTHEGTETVIGVIKDFHMHSMQLAINPLMLRLAGAGSSWFSVKVRPEQLPETLEYLEEVISGHTAYPFEYAFLDQQFSELYLADVRIGQLFGGLTLISLLIASVGLFGLAALASKRRTKEMGIRKVFGASVRHLTGLLSLDFLKLILIASFVAAPFAWFVMHLWLLDFAYRITLDWWMLPLAGLSTLLIALVTVSSQSIKAAMTNPIACLKDE